MSPFVHASAKRMNVQMVAKDRTTLTAPGILSDLSACNIRDDNELPTNGNERDETLPQETVEGTLS